MNNIFTPVYGVFKRDLNVAMHRKSDILTILFFFLIVVSLYPLSVSADRDILRHIAPGVLWVAALLATVLSLNRLFEQDYDDGTLEQLLLSSTPFALLITGKIAAYWLITGLPLTILAPLLALQFDLAPQSQLTLAISLLIGTPILSLTGAVGASLTLGLRNGNVLVTLLVLPLFIPVLIFGTSAINAVSAGLSPDAELSILGALLALALFFAPWACAAALQVALE